uniref:Uncharacterized protein n=1 Tax=Arundo donax TaxID=35708 RepID=A0A0A8Z8Q0_ARUDO
MLQSFIKFFLGHLPVIY